METNSEGYGDQFNILCDNVESNILLTNSVIQEFLAFNLELSKYNLPTPLLLRFALMSSKLQRSINDANTQVDEIVRLTRIYSVSWEQRSQSLKKLHQQYNSKQRKLDIAVNKLELLNGRNQQLEKQRIVMNWEKMFLKLNSSKHSSLGWRHIVDEYNKKMSAGESVAYLFKNLNSDIDQRVGESKKQGYYNKNTNIMDDLATEFNAEDELDIESHISIDDSLSNDDLFSDHSETEEELKLVSRIESNSIINWVSRNEEYDTLVEIEVVSSEDQEKVEELDDVGDIKHLEIKRSSISDMNRSFLGSFETVREEVNVEMADKATATTIQDEYYYKLFMHVYKPRCFNEKELCVVVAFNDHLQKGEVFTINPQDIDPSLELSTTDFQAADLTDVKELQEFCFDIDYYNGSDIFNCDTFQESKLRIAVHPGLTKGMIAFSSAVVKDLTIVDDEGSNNDDNDEKNHSNINEKKDNSSVSINELTLLATVEKGKMKFNQPCGQIFIKCFLTREKKYCFQDKYTETISLNDIVDEILSAKRNSYLKRCKSAGVETDEKPVYTEDDVSMLRHQLTEELIDLKTEYEEKLEDVLKTHDIDSNDLVNMATSPIFKWDIEFSPESSPLDYHGPVQSAINIPPSSLRENGIIRSVSSKKWGKNLPRDFYTRLDMFQEASEKYHKELKHKINSDTDKEITKKLKAERKLHKEGKESVYSADVCLPALFMPIKSHLSNPPKARSFLSSGNRSNRIMQQHSMMQLPRLKTAKVDKLIGMCVEADVPSANNNMSNAEVH